jgi:putative hydrolase of the HAD superfamily
MTVRGVLLDLGGVFVVPEGARITRALQEAGITVEAIDFQRAHFRGVAAVEQGADDREDLPDYFGGYMEAMGIREHDWGKALEVMRHLWSQPSVDLWRQVIASSVLGLRQLAARGLPLGFVSNSDGTAEQQLGLHGIAQVGPGQGTEVLAIVDSAVIGIAKPDPRAITPAIEALGREPSDIIYIGDTVRYDVQAAEQAGLLPIHFDPYEMCRSSHHHQHVRSLGDVDAVV